MNPPAAELFPMTSSLAGSLPPTSNIEEMEWDPVIEAGFPVDDNGILSSPAHDDKFHYYNNLDEEPRSSLSPISYKSYTATKLKDGIESDKSRSLSAESEASTTKDRIKNNRWTHSRRSNKNRAIQRKRATSPATKDAPIEGAKVTPTIPHLEWQHLNDVQVDEGVAPRLIDSGFRAIQKNAQKENSKKISFNERGYFVENQNKTGTLYFLIDKADGHLVANVELLALNDGDTFKLKAYRSAEGVSAQRVGEKVAALVRVNATGKFSKDPALVHLWEQSRNEEAGKYQPVPLCDKITKRVVDACEYPILAATKITVPSNAGKYLIEIYPLIGFQSSTVDERPEQLVAISFPEFENLILRSRPFKMVSKDPDMIRASTGKKRKRT